MEKKNKIYNNNPRFSLTKEKFINNKKYKDTSFRNSDPKQIARLQNAKYTSLEKTSLPSLNQTYDIPKISGKSAYVYDVENNAVIYKLNELDKRQIASLTKIMTCWVTIQYIRKNQLIPQDEYLTVSKNAALINGTTSQLEEGDTLSIWDLLHGLMLPSGNDAAICLAQNIGGKFQNKKKTNLDNFVQQMNLWATRFEMKNTFYVNPHGLSNKLNRSTVQDQMILIRNILNDSLFKRIIDKRLYFCSIQEKDGWTRQLFWQSFIQFRENTNKLLFRGFSGIKTGSTTTAGFCLASWYKKQNINLVIIILGANSSDQRFNDTINLTKWAIKQKYQSSKDFYKDKDNLNLFD